MLGEKELVQRNVEKLMYYVDFMREGIMRWWKEISDDVVFVVESVVGKEVVENLKDPYKLSWVKLFGITSSVVMELDRELVERFEELEDELGDDVGYLEDIQYYCKEIFETLMIVDELYHQYGKWVGDMMVEFNQWN